MTNGPKVMCIAGKDSTGLAGLDQDRRTVEALGCVYLPVLTARALQDPTTQQSVALENPQDVFDAIQRGLGSEKIAAVKIGMLGSLEIVEAVKMALKAFRGPVVLDTVLVASSGLVLLERRAWPALKLLAEHCALVTPNLPEFEALGGAHWPIQGPILLKGGHGEGSTLVDRLIWPGGETFQKSHRRLDLANSRGTGCALSSAIACNLAFGVPLQKAVSAGIDWQQGSFRTQAVP
jgi:hydroxymethylpyrimidine/phosphomethylpyrimidine kinase